MKMKEQLTKKDKSKGEIILYKAPDGTLAIDVKLEEETVWLTFDQVCKLFSKAKSTISYHINGIFKEGELDRSSTVRNFRTVQTEGKRLINRELEYYNLDIIISVGYRVKSKQGTQFRIWANKVLKDYLLRGYALNERKLKEQTERIREIEATLDIFSKVATNYELSQNEFAGILKVVSDYTQALDLLDDYDYQKVKIKETTSETRFVISHTKAVKVIKELKQKFGISSLFGKEKDSSFKSSIETIYQTFSGKELYPSIEEKAANLLYFIIKNHSFVDGNKRIAAAIFLWFLDENQILYKQNGVKRLADNALVALCLMIAESNPKEKEIITKVVVNLINKNN
ncbi:MAG: filamentation induced by cAMP protein fic [Ignavibacteria bacterium]|nr:MAG: filamentation induced by cAMP protein fic [Ignavibacteria bacterium]KAF0161650.1 MAG: filamentation induced by cAMP protein fic [Ignavibacteria bacterium]